jgi:F-type H+-transporting ATPase subunit b
MEILEALGNIGFDWRIAIANFINFVIVYFLLNKFVFKPLTKTLDARRAKIESGLQHADDAIKIRDKATAERNQILRNARQEAGEILANAREKEQKVISGSTDKATAEAQKIIVEAKQKAVDEHDTMTRNFKSEAASLVVAAAEKLLQDDIVSDQKQAVARKYLSQVKVNNDSKVTN